VKIDKFILHNSEECQTPHNKNFFLEKKNKSVEKY
jgi:hypothetical protein